MKNAKRSPVQSPLIPYPVRESRRAKHVSIKVSHAGVVEVVVPVGLSPTRVAKIVQERQDWIARTLARLADERENLPSTLVDSRPSQVVFGALPETWRIVYVPQGGVSEAIRRNRLVYQSTAQNVLTISGPVMDTRQCQHALQHWLKQKAKRHLPCWLQQVSQEVNLPCNQISIRKQRTLWASCSGQKNISLNCKLLFLPPHLVRYVFVHELCHTVHMNHSAQFWGLVERIDPHYEWKDQELREAWKYVPQWAEDES
jgi:predicted metal-dependent hydrolase